MQCTNLKLQRINNHICFNIHSKNGIIKKACAFLALIFLLLSGCHKNDNPVSTGQLSQEIFGKVIDSQGNPIEGCGIHYIYTMSTSSLAKIGKTCPSTSIQFNIPTTSKVTVKILRWYTRDTIATLVDDTLSAGVHLFTFNASKVTNGIYIAQIQTDTAIQEQRLALSINDISALITTTPLVTTNSSGSFNIPYGVFGFSLPFAQTSLTGSSIDTVYVSHTIQMVVCKSGYVTATKTITIDEANGVNQTFTLVKQ